MGSRGAGVCCTLCCSVARGPPSIAMGCGISTEVNERTAEDAKGPLPEEVAPCPAFILDLSERNGTSDKSQVYNARRRRYIRSQRILSQSDYDDDDENEFRVKMNPFPLPHLPPPSQTTASATAAMTSDIDQQMLDEKIALMREKQKNIAKQLAADQNQVAVVQNQASGGDYSNQLQSKAGSSSEAYVDGSQLTGRW